MKREQFDHFVIEVRVRGFDMVLGDAGVTSLTSWRPYGVFDRSNPGIEQHMGESFIWIPPNLAVDPPPPGPRGIASLVWQFFRTEPGPDLTPEVQDPLTPQVREQTLALRGMPRPEPDLLAIRDYDSVRQLEFYRLKMRSERGAQWLAERPPEGPERNTLWLAKHPPRPGPIQTC